MIGGDRERGGGREQMMRSIAVSSWILWQKQCLKGARTYYIINEQDQLAAKECNRKLY